MGLSHRTVLLQEAVDALQVVGNGIYIDATFGRGGHTSAILEKLGRDGILIVMDQDPEAIACAERLYTDDRRVHICHTAFSGLKQYASNLSVDGKVNGVLFDLGVSSPQLDQAGRGFSFLHDGPLDMRMNPQQGVSAKDWIATASVEEMTEVFRDYGEERYARRIAQAIDRARAQHAIASTAQLAKIVSEAHPAWEQHKHPATRVFQALRIFINRELHELETALPLALDVLAGGGRLAVISFHSLEDRIVKNFMRDGARGYTQAERLPARLPVRETPTHVRLGLVGKASRPTDEEVSDNPRARSAILRVAEKIA